MITVFLCANTTRSLVKNNLILTSMEIKTAKYDANNVFFIQQTIH